MKKVLVNIFCAFIPFKKQRDILRRRLLNYTDGFPVKKFFNGKYNIVGSNNKIIIIENGKERLLRKNEVINGLNIKIKGNNNLVKLTLPIIAKNSKIDIGNDDAVVEIGSTRRLDNFYLRCKFGNGQIFKCGNNTTTIGVRIIEDDTSSCIIGEDCMFSDNISIWASDGHSILDKDTGEILNTPKGPVIIGNHVWVGQGVRITKNARIYDNSIIGGGAVAYKDYKENNVIIAGNPGKIVRENISWDRRNSYDLSKIRKEDK